MIIQIVLIFLTHWVSDFLCQTHEMSLKKSKSILWLSYHVIIYTLVTTVSWSLFFNNLMLDMLTTIPLVFLITFTSHWITDFFTSRWTSMLWGKQSIHNFFVVIGFDQLIHATTLLLTFNYLIHTI